MACSSHCAAVSRDRTRSGDANSSPGRYIAVDMGGPCGSRTQPNTRSSQGSLRPEGKEADPIQPGSAFAVVYWMASLRLLI